MVLFLGDWNEFIAVKISVCCACDPVNLLDERRSQVVFRSPRTPVAYFDR
jgi:hypothetical protein